MTTREKNKDQLHNVLLDAAGGIKENVLDVSHDTPDVKKIINTKKVKKKTPNAPLDATGRRKVAVARVFYYSKQSAKGRDITVNNKKLVDYFKNMQHYISSLLRPLDLAQINDCKIKITVRGGGETGQADAIRHGIARVLVDYNPEYREIFKAAQLLKRDSRRNEKKLSGHYKSRAAYPYVAR